MPSDNSSAIPVWDPAGDTVTAETFAATDRKCQMDLAWYRAHPGHLRRMRFLLGMLLVVGLAAAGWMLLSNISLPLLPVLISIIPFIAYTGRVKALQKDLVELLIAEKHGWIYSPEQRSARWSRLNERLPFLFNLGRDQSIQDEFWGMTRGRTAQYPFWLGLFQYTVGSGKSSHTEQRFVIGFHLPAAAPKNFGLQPEGIGALFAGLVHRDIETESTAFNKTFFIHCNGNAKAAAEDVLRVLSPAVQTGLLDLHSELGTFSFCVQGDAVFFSCSNFLPQVLHTNFFRSLELDPRDEQEMDKAFGRLLDVVDEVVKYIE